MSVRTKDGVVQQVNAGYLELDLRRLGAGQTLKNRRAFKNLLALGKGFTAELKRSGTSNLGREICAFANATGGLILLGVNDSRGIVGSNNHNRSRLEARAIARPGEPPRVLSTFSAGPGFLPMWGSLPLENLRRLNDKQMIE